MDLSKRDLELLELTSVPKEAMEILKDHFNKDLYQYYGYSSYDMDYVPKDAICIILGEKLISGDFLRRKIQAINKELERQKIDAYAFATEFYIGLSEGQDSIAIIPTKDDMEAIKIAGTEGFNYDISDDEIISKLQLWKRVLNCDYRVIYADMQQVDLEFIKRPTNIRKIAIRVNYISPEICNRLEGGFEELVRIIDSENIFSLFWD